MTETQGWFALLILAAMNWGIWKAGTAIECIRDRMGELVDAARERADR